MPVLTQHIQNTLASLNITTYYWHRYEYPTNVDVFAIINQYQYTEANTKQDFIVNGNLVVQIFEFNRLLRTPTQYLRAFKPTRQFMPDDCFIFEVQSVRIGTSEIANKNYLVTTITIKFAKNIQP